MSSQIEEGSSADIHPDAPAGGGGRGRFRSAKPLGMHPELDRWRSPPPLGRNWLETAQLGSEGSLASTDAQAKDSSTTTNDPEIEALNLSETAKRAAYALKNKHSSVVFTSGRRDKQQQAWAMAGHVVKDRNWIKKTYAASTARNECQKWVDDNTDKKTRDEIATGLKGVLDGLTDTKLAGLSKHLSGDAFDVQPVEQDANAIKRTIRSLSGLSNFLEKEGNDVVWHAEF